MFPAVVWFLWPETKCEWLLPCVLSDSCDQRPSVSGSFSVCYLIPMTRDQVWVVPSLCVGWFLWPETKCEWFLSLCVIWFLWPETKCEWFLLCVLADSYDTETKCEWFLSLCVIWFLWPETKCEWFLLCVLADSYDLRPSVSGSFSACWLIPMIWDQVWVVLSLCVVWFLWSETKCEWFLLCVLSNSYDPRPIVSDSFSPCCLIPMIWDQVWVVPSLCVVWFLWSETKC